MLLLLLLLLIASAVLLLETFFDDDADVTRFSIVAGAADGVAAFDDFAVDGAAADGVDFTATAAAAGCNFFDACRSARALASICE